MTDDLARPAALAALAADGPYAPHAEALMLFGRFVGSWALDSVELQPDGREVERRGEWHFTWVIGGRAVQDVIFERGAPRDEYGTTLRSYDAAAGVWRVTYEAPGLGEFASLIARPVGDTIVLEGSADDGRLRRWTFWEIRPDAFRWRGEVSHDGGATWAVRHEMTARRVKPGADPDQSAAARADSETAPRRMTDQLPPVS